MTRRLERLTRSPRTGDKAQGETLRVLELKRRKLPTRDEIAMLEAGLLVRN